ncbi:EscI/YscI/HrpB family type III secretion system inner rod protein [Pandoraea morbifera]|uniref:EscI/YscI/HrpB family type III secretion system inner rod protein n=1 Tax=Pandoraea morbifera TaxID=2508300 RepID=A0A5E4SKK8_9BURK|nr:type III secretion system inner rod subunit SctI [Pandoraea morbifera]VVD75332.1 EscI/YscI/HrpB family type III secretion system inner rod protein [Pandoraea morbifera]
MTPSQLFNVTAQAVDAASLTNVALATAGAGETDAVGFAQAMAHAPRLPEHHLLSAAGKLAGDTDRLAERITAQPGTVDDPGRLLAAQRHLTERVLSLEFVAKVAGAATQGVNKLVHMQ